MGFLLCLLGFLSCTSEDDAADPGAPLDSPVPVKAGARPTSLAPGALDPALVIPGVIDDALAWIVGACYHEGGGFYLAPHTQFWTWDTVVTVWLFDWLAASGFDVSGYDLQIADARRWIEAARHADGSYTFMPPQDKGSCTETTSLASLVVPDPVTDAWIVAEQLPDGHWRYPYPFVEDPDYPSVTVHPLYAAACRNLPVDWEAALAWLQESEWSANPDAYSSRFYVTYLLAAVAGLRDDVPDALRESMREVLLAQQGPDGSFEGRTMEDNPSAVVPTALALQTALLLDDDSLGPVIHRAALFLLRHVEEDHWRGGRYRDDHPKDESLFATVHAIRALAMFERRAARASVDPCSAGAGIP